MPSVTPSEDHTAADAEEMASEEPLDDGPDIMGDLLADSLPPSPQRAGEGGLTELTEEPVSAQPSQAAAFTAMASLSALTREAAEPQQEAKRHKVTPAEDEAVSVVGGEEEQPEIGEDVEYVIDRVIGGSRLDAEAVPFYRLEWVGHNDINWQGLSDPPQVDEDADYLGMQVKVLPLGTAAHFLDHGRCPSRKQQSIVLVVGELIAPDQPTRICYAANGVSHELNFAECLLDGEHRDWLLDQDRRVRWLTDHIIDWETAGAGVKEARAAWGDGDFFPTLEDSVRVLLHLGLQVMDTVALATPKQRQMALDIAVFMREPQVCLS